MTELLPREDALIGLIVKEIAASPGLPVRELGVLIHASMSTTLRVVQKLVDAGILERRQDRRVREDGRVGTYSGLWLSEKPAAGGSSSLGELANAVEGQQGAEKAAATPVDPSLCPACGARIRHFEGGSACIKIGELRAWGASHSYPRVPLASALSIQAGEMMWLRWLNQASDPALVEALRQTRNIGDLLAATS